VRNDAPAAAAALSSVGTTPVRRAGSNNSGRDERGASAAAVPIQAWGEQLLGWSYVSPVMLTAVFLQRLDFMAMILTECGKYVP